jgi:hypothetical protein
MKQFECIEATRQQSPCGRDLLAEGESRMAGASRSAREYPMG